MPFDLKAARNKLRQARLLLAHLEALPQEIARDMARAGSRDYQLELETFFSACLSASRSVFYVLNESRAEFKPIEQHWRNHVLDESGRRRFNAMLNLRDNDIHFGETGAEALPTMMEMEINPWPGTHYNEGLFGPPPTLEHTAPDGKIVRARALRSTFGLYVDVADSRMDAAAACAAFIGQMETLVRAVEAAVAPPPAEHPRS